VFITAVMAFLGQKMSSCVFITAVPIIKLFVCVCVFITAVPIMCLLLCVVCVYYCSTYYKSVRVGGGGETMEDMCYERLLGPVRNPVLYFNTGWRPVSPGSSRLGIQTKTPG
jgi:hypothetical protein